MIVTWLRGHIPRKSLNLTNSNLTNYLIGMSNSRRIQRKDLTIKYRALSRNMTSESCHISWWVWRVHSSKSPSSDSSHELDDHLTNSWVMSHMNESCHISWWVWCVYSSKSHSSDSSHELDESSKSHELESHELTDRRKLGGSATLVKLLRDSGTGVCVCVCVSERERGTEIKREIERD